MLVFDLPVLLLEGKRVNSPNLQELRSNVLMVCCRKNKAKPSSLKPCVLHDYYHFSFLHLSMIWGDLSQWGMCSFLFYLHVSIKKRSKESRKLPLCAWIYRENAGEWCGGVFSTPEGTPNYSRTIFRSLDYISYKVYLIIGVPLSP